jgi:hypothetical protein
MNDFCGATLLGRLAKIVHLLISEQNLTFRLFPRYTLEEMVFLMNEYQVLRQ